MTTREEQPVRMGRLLWLIIAVSLTVHVVTLLLGQSVLHEWRWRHLPVHASLEVAGAMIALVVAWLLLTLDKRGEGTSYNVWIAGALCGMGILDGLHALVHDGKLFVWLHSTATFVGGLLFTFVWFPKTWLGERKQRWPAGVATVVILFGVLSLISPALIPAMVEGGKFTFWALALNIGGGVLLFVAAIRLVLTWRQTNNVDDLLFCLHCLLFGAAAIMFEQSRLWDAPWWGWHFLRLMAYGVALWFVILTEQRADQKYQRITADLRELSATLEQRVAERTEQLEKANQKLAREQFLLKELVDNIPDPVFFKDRECRFIRVNQAMAHDAGFEKPEDLIGKTDADLWTGALPGTTLTDEQRIMETGEPIINKEEMPMLPGGEERWVLVTKMPLKDETGAILGIFGTARYITEQKLQEKELAAGRRAAVNLLQDAEEARRLLALAKDEADAANRAKSEFLANMSHEIRTPMNGIIGMADLLFHTSLDDEQTQYLDMVKQSADALLRLLNDILDFSKIEAGKLELESIPFTLHDTIGKTGKTLAVRAAEKGLELACRVDPQLPEHLIGDPGRLRQILINLAGNAIKFTEQGEVVISVREEFSSAENVGLHFTVRDTGIGISPENQAKIFEAFAQADASTTRRFGGTGLGLSISSHLVGLMQGRIWLESEIGQGTTFHFTGVFAIDTEPPDEATVELADLKNLPVLVVDDNATNCRILQEMFQHWHMNPTVVHNGLTALTELQRAASAGQPFRLVLLDYMMPEMDGLMLAERIRGHPELGTPILFMLSSAGRVGEAKRCGDVGIARYMTKPVGKSELLDSILEVFCKGEALELNETVRQEPTVSSGVKILLAEDGVINQRVALGVLARHHHEVVVANNGREALAAYAKQSFDLILMDVQMPQLDGLAATRELRQQEQGTDRHVPIIAMTAGAMKGDRERCLDAGMDDYISKPIQAEQLLALVGRYTPTALEKPPPPLPTVDVPVVAENFDDVIDLAVAVQNIPGGEKNLGEFAELLIQECDKSLGEMHAGLAANDPVKVRRGAHTIKGSATLFGAREVMETALQLEKWGDANRLDEVREQLPVFEEQLQRLRAALATLIV